MNKKSFLTLFVVAAFLSVAIESCKEDEVAVTGVTLDKKTHSLVESGTVVLVPTVLPENAANKNVTWESDKPAVATVAGGVVTGVAQGTAKITVKTVDGGKTATCDITVTKEVTGVTITPSPASVAVDNEITLTAAIQPAGATDQSVTWSKGTVAGDVTLTPSGLTCKVKGVTTGKIDVIVTTGNSKTAKCEVTVTPGAVAVTGVSLNPNTAQTLAIDDKLTFTASILPAEATNKNVTWSQSGTGEVTLAADGLSCEVTGKTKGAVTITVTTEDGAKTATCTVNVIAIGADFSASAVKVYNFTGATKPKQDGEDLFAGHLAFYFADMDLDKVLISGSRRYWNADAAKRAVVGMPKYYNLSDLKAGNATPHNLSNVFGEGIIYGGVGGGSHEVSRMAHGHVYGARLVTGQRSVDDPLWETLGQWGAIWHWPALSADPELLIEYKYKVGGAYDQGDQMSLDIDANGNGYIFVSGWAQGWLARMKVTNFNQVNEAEFTGIAPGNTPIAYDYTSATADGEPGFKTMQRVDGTTGEYIYTNNFEPVRLVTADGDKLYTMTSFVDNDLDVSEGKYNDALAARVISFNGARYLVCMRDTKPQGKGAITVFDITEGESTLQALQKFDARNATNKVPVYTFSLNGEMLPNEWRKNGAVSIGFAKDADKLYIVGSAETTGVAVIE
jgi:uncharacterized protein YjdB